MGFISAFKGLKHVANKRKLPLWRMQWQTTSVQLNLPRKSSVGSPTA